METGGTPILRGYRIGAVGGAEAGGAGLEQGEGGFGVEDFFAGFDSEFRADGLARDPFFADTRDDVSG
jgi:hypothetical protein